MIKQCAKLSIRVVPIDMSKLALQADVCYNEDLKYCGSEGAANTFRLVTHLLRRQVTMDTLSSHADNGNSSSHSRQKRVSLTCSTCGKTFTRPPSNIHGAKHHFCNKDCWHTWHSRGEDLQRTCKHCSQEFTILRRNLNNSHRTGEFCSHACKMEWRKGENSPVYKGEYVERTCEACGKVFFMFPSDARVKGAGRFCSRDCKDGKNHPWYRHGEGYKGYTKNFPTIATTIRRRDGRCCMLCKQSRREDGKRLRLDVHHIDHDRQNNSRGNLITLCRHCHSMETNCKPEERILWQQRLSNLLYQTYGGAI